MAEGYQYTPLSAHDKEIRVLILDPMPENPSDIVSGTLNTVSLGFIEDENAPDYETVSYVWGDATLRSTIQLDGHEIDVPRSAAEALRRFQHSNKRILWIDEICINQADLDERSQQVILMGEIYRNGIRNLIYLGEDDGTVESAKNSIKMLCDQEIDLEMSRVRSLNHLTFNPDGDFQMSSWPLRVRIDQNAVNKFFSKPWFSRLWVVQEAVLSPNSTCYCGPYKIRLWPVLLVAFWLSYKKIHLDPDLHDKWKGQERASRMFDFMPSVHTAFGSGEFKPDILVLLDLARAASCSDPRDKVFAILGLLKWSGSPEIPWTLEPDYTIELKDLLVAAATLAIEEEVEDGIEKILSEVGHRSNEDIHLDGLPSWVPRWQRSWDIEEDASRMVFQNGLALQYDMGWLPRQTLQVYEGDSSSGEICRWILEGFEVDIVEDVHQASQPTFEWRNFAADYLIPLKSMFGDLGRKNCMGDVSELLTFERGADLDGISSEHMREIVAHLETLLRLGPGKEWEDRHFEVETAIIAACKRRTVGKTKEGRPALLPFVAAAGDIVVQLLEVSTPMILRRVGDGYEVIGQAYVHGIMHGESVRAWDGELESFSLM